MNITANSPVPIYDWHVLVLHDGTELDILGIWGPYLNEPDAEAALAELQTWPLDGVWSITALKAFPAPTTKTTTAPHTVTWNPPYGVRHHDG